MSGIIGPIGILGGLGVIFGVVLSFASKVFVVETNPQVDAVRNVLPGVNCGACGFPGCDGLAEGIVLGKAAITSCSVGGQPVAEKIAEVMGVETQVMDKEVATVLCQGNIDLAKSKYNYIGIKDCRAQNMVSGGAKSCFYGCLGCGTCKDVCEFGAIEIVNGLAVIDRDKCTTCKKCLAICPKNLIKLVPYEQQTFVRCNSSEKGKDVRGKCNIGCIGCGICAKNCPVDAIEIRDNLAYIDYEKCINCGLCAEKCPTKAIEFRN